ncbi:MAG: M23 family metallopeptidase [Candidatus Omnitrophica bacterium]|nr:M23 family metallopeptidase [Candidatus Omnitrophota bacterium]MCM8793188.1 M23 family metallopeptidase [Candidatus Omnitrophota bacterium]
MEKINEANHLKDATMISEGQLIFVPCSPESPTRRKLEDKGFIWPIKGEIISSFGTKKADGTVNRGIDILPRENLHILAVKKGKVIFSSEKIKGWGKMLIIEHDEQLYSIYGNISAILVKPGQEVQQGELIAEAKNDIVHFEIRKGHIPQNPLYFLP